MELSDINNIIQKLKMPNKDHEAFLETNAKNNPFEQFVDWFRIALEKEHKPTIMILATIDKNGFPNTRAVALQELQPNQLIFYSTYQGRKAQDIAHQNIVAVNFYWPNLARQVRIVGNIEKLEREKCENYFSNRKREIQLTLHGWTQSSILSDREELEAKMKSMTTQFKNKPIPCPDHWGGYKIIPFAYEFYQRREWFMNDIFLYTLKDEEWQRIRLAP